MPGKVMNCCKTSSWFIFRSPLRSLNTIIPSRHSPPHSTPLSERHKVTSLPVLMADILASWMAFDTFLITVSACLCAYMVWKFGSDSPRRMDSIDNTSKSSTRVNPSPLCRVVPKPLLSTKRVAFPETMADFELPTDFELTAVSEFTAVFEFMTVFEFRTVLEFMTVHLRVIMVIYCSQCRSNYGICSRKGIHE